MADNVIQIIAEFIDKASPGLEKLSGSSIPILQSALAGLAGGVAGGAAVAIFEKLAEVVKDVVLEIPKLTLEAINAADELGKMAQRTGIAIESLSGMKLAADLADVSIKELISSSRKLGKSMEEALDPSSKQALLFKNLGISVIDASGKLRNVDDVMGDVADKFKESADDVNKVNYAMELGGRGMVQSITLLNGGREALVEGARLVKEFRLDFTPEQSRMAELFNDSITKLKDAFAGIGYIIAKELLPSLSTTLDYMSKSAEEGGILRGVFDGIGQTISFLLTPIRYLTIGFATLMAIIKATGIQLAGFAAAASQALSLDFDAAGQTLRQMEEDTKKVYEDLAVYVDKMQNPDKYIKKEEAAKESLGSLGLAAQKLADEFDKVYEAMGKELTMLDQTGKTSQVIYETLYGTMQKFNAEQKQMLIERAREIDLAKLRLDLLKQEQSLRDQLNSKVSTAEVNNNAAQIADPRARAGYTGAANQSIAMNNFLNNQQEIADKNTDATVRARLTAEIEAKRKLYAQNGLMYEQARKLSEVEYDLTQATKNYNDAVGNSSTQLAELTTAQAKYKELLEAGTISQDRYNELMKNSTRAMEDVTFNLTSMGKAMKSVEDKRRSLTDIQESMTNVTKSFNEGGMSAAEYKKELYDLQSSFDSVNPTFAINQVEKLNEEIKSTAGAFEGMFSDYLFQGMQGKWQNLGDMVKKQIDRMVASMIAAKIQMALFGDLGSTPAGKTPASTGLIGGLFSSFFGGAREMGGPVQAGMSYLVGEKRPELFTPSVNGTISPNTGGTKIYISAVDTQSFNQALAKDPRFLASLVGGARNAYGIK